eukprot:TRINITY_DN5497_c0_g3_i1.p1 TRINITY_DN5497_c0_g3~~TRINITY_DN5497_c0_g3_i1.p1  ORF type:complete len:413 (-),score=100.77 TRINITY_DN5497_c0_g3_i1:889-2127(-)
MSVTTDFGYYRGELLIVGKENGALEIYKEDFKLIYRCKNIPEGMAILRNDTNMETSRLEAQKSISDVTGNIDTPSIPFTVDRAEEHTRVQELLLANVNGKPMLLVHLSNEDTLLYEGYYYCRSSPGREELSLRFKRMEMGNELVQLGESKEKSCVGRRFHLCKDKDGNNCVLIISVSRLYWLFSSHKKVFLHKGREKGQIRSAAQFSTSDLQNAYLLCEDSTLKICKLQSKVAYYYPFPFQQIKLASVPTKLALFAPSENEKYIIAAMKGWTPISFDISTVPQTQTQTQQVGIAISVLGEQFKYSIIAIDPKNPYQPMSEVKADKGEIINTIAVVPLKINDYTRQYLLAGISKIPSEASESPTTGRLILYSVVQVMTFSWKSGYCGLWFKSTCCRRRQFSPFSRCAATLQSA